VREIKWSPAPPTSLSLARNFHLRCIELFGAKADGRFNAQKLPRIFEALLLQRLNSRMS